MILREEIYKIFEEEYLKNQEFKEMLNMIYFDSEELWIEKEYGEPNEEALERIFSWIFSQDSEQTRKNPVNVAWFLQKKYKEKLIKI